MIEKEVFKNHKQKKIFAVSGGPDSMYMLELYRQKIGADQIVVCHVNYNFRNDSIIDQNLVEHYCQKHEIKLEIKTVSKSMYQELSQNFEDFARVIRYDFFAKTAKKYKTDIVFVAHNENDLVETYLLQKQRQSIVNYYGLQPLTKWSKEMWVYRPLLKVKKSEILKFNEQNHIPYHLDETNFDPKYARNKIRLTLDEKKFPTYLKEIHHLNKTIAKDQKQVSRYLRLNFLDNQTLLLKKKFFTFNPEVKKRILFNYFQLIGHEELLLKRKKQTLQELLKLVDNQEKPILQMKIADQIVVKDFDELYVVDESFFEIYTIELKSKADLKKIKNTKLRKDIVELIDKDGWKLPYKLTNDYEDYKKHSVVKTKKTNRYFIQQKIKYKTRIKVPALINNGNEVINIKSFFKIWDN